MLDKTMFKRILLIFITSIVLLSLNLQANGWYGQQPVQQPYGYYAPAPYYAVPVYPQYPAYAPQYHYGYAMPVSPQPQQKPEAEPEITVMPIEAQKADVKKAAVIKNVMTEENKVSDKTPSSKKSAKSNDHKQAFLDKLLPVISKANQQILAQRNWLLDIHAKLTNGKEISDSDAAQLNKLAKAYRVDGNPVSQSSARSKLIIKVDIIPASMALAQAANESAWGKSRFAREANNLFGIWTYDESQGLIPKNRAEGKKHFVRKFDSIDDSVTYYMLMLNSHPAYANLRDIRQQLRLDNEIISGEKLAAGLLKYSAKGETYISLIRQLISQNDWATFDPTQASSA